MKNMADRHDGALKSAAVTWCYGCRWVLGSVMSSPALAFLTHGPVVC